MNVRTFRWNHVGAHYAFRLLCDMCSGASMTIAWFFWCFFFQMETSILFDDWKSVCAAWESDKLGVLRWTQGDRTQPDILLIIIQFTHRKWKIEMSISRRMEYVRFEILTRHINEVYHTSIHIHTYLHFSVFSSTIWLEMDTELGRKTFAYIYTVLTR